MATPTNLSGHSAAAPTNKAGNGAATAANLAAHRRLGGYTFDEIGTKTVSQFSDKTFDTAISVPTNIPSH